MIEDLEEVLEIFIDSKLRDVHTCLPGKIESYESATRKAKVKPMVKLKYKVGAEIQSFELPVIDNVPVIFPSSADFSFSFPLQRDYSVLLLFSESPIGNYLNNGIISEAESLQRFALTECIAIPGLFSFGNIPNTQLKIEIGIDKSILIQSTVGKIKIEESGNITLNDGTEPFIKGNTLKTMFTTLCLTIATATSGTTEKNAAGIETIKTAFSIFNGQLATIVSAQIKGL